MRYQRDEYTPWSFVAPIALAVMLGVLAADLVRIGVAAVMLKAAVDEMNKSARAQTTPGHLPARPNYTTAQVAAPAAYHSRASLPELPGLLRANRDGLNEACIAGTISHRVENGWSQDFSTGSPQPCRSNSQ